MRAALFSCVAAGALLGGCGGRPDGPNVLLISLDSVRADDLTFLDPAIAPHMTELAKRGVVFTQAISGSSWTLPAHVQMLTGQPPSLHRVETDDIAIDPRTPLLQELLRRAGYFTAGFWTGWYLAGEYGFARGFVSYENAMTDGELVEGTVSKSLDQDTIAKVWQALSERDRKNHEDVNSPRVVELAREALARAEPDEPVFFFAHFFDPHYDYVPPGKWATVHDPDYQGSIDGRSYWVNQRVFKDGKRAVNDRDLAHLRALYRGEIGWTDESVGALLALFAAAGRLQNTLVIITADHGEEFFEHENRGHKQSLYDEVLRVPLLVVPPGALAGEAPRAIDAQVELSDLMPTVLDFAGLEAPPTVYGRSLRPAVEGQPIESRPVVSSLQLYDSKADGTWKVMLQETLRMPGRKLWRQTDVDQRLTPQLFHTALWEGDPLELAWVGAVGRNVERFQPFWDLLEAELARMRAIQEASPRSLASERTTRMAELLASELKGLGYVGPESSDESVGLRVPWGLRVRPPLAPPW
jgi:arylsulfatase A-like enzyme